MSGDLSDSGLAWSSPLDGALAASVPCVLLPDKEGLLRYDDTWTRDAFNRNPGPHALEDTWTLLRDRDTGFVTFVLATSPTLLAGHPRADVAVYPTAAAAMAVRTQLGPIPILREGPLPERVG